MTQEILGAPNRIEANPGTRNLLTKSDGTALDAVALPSSAGTWILTQMYRIGPVRKLVVEAQYDAAAAATGYPSIRPLVCSIPTPQPAVADDVWTGLPVTDGVVTAQAQPGTAATGLVEAHGPLMGYQKHRGLVWEPEAVVANSAKIRASLVLAVEGFHWIMFEVAESGATGTPGKLRLYLTGSA